MLDAGQWWCGQVQLDSCAGEMLWSCALTANNECARGLARALKGVRCVVALGQLRALLPACKKAGVQRVLLLSTSRWVLLVSLRVKLLGAAGRLCLRGACYCTSHVDRGPCKDTHGCVGHDNKPAALLGTHKVYAKGCTSCIW